jgi:hypothetical protein
VTPEREIITRRKFVGFISVDFSRSAFYDSAIAEMERHADLEG